MNISQGPAVKVHVDTELTSVKNCIQYFRRTYGVTSASFTEAEVTMLMIAYKNYYNAEQAGTASLATALSTGII